MSTPEITHDSVSKLSEWRSKIAYQGLLLGVICAVVTFSLLLGDKNTINAINARQMEDRLVNLAQVMPPTLYDNNPLKDAQLITDAEMGSSPVEVYPARKHGQLTAVAFQASTIGYGGAISLMIGIDKEGQILGVRVLAHKETPGLADKIELDKSDWITHFNGLSLTNTSPKEWAVKKDGGNIDQFTGATITPRAMVKGIHNSLLFFQRHQQQWLNSPSSTATLKTGENPS